MSAAAAALKKTPLHEVHKASGAKMVDFGGWDMPVQHSGILDEHQPVRRAVDLRGLPGAGALAVEGIYRSKVTGARPSAHCHAMRLRGRLNMVEIHTTTSGLFTPRAPK